MTHEELQEIFERARHVEYDYGEDAKILASDIQRLLFHILELKEASSRIWLTILDKFDETACDEGEFRDWLKAHGSVPQGVKQ